MRPILPLLALLLAAAPALAQDEAAKIAEGKRLAEINCTKCHNIEATGESPLTDAPPFREIAKNYDEMELVDGFMEGLAVRHPLMPDWEVTEPQAEELAAFVMSLGSGEAKTANDAVTQGFDLLRANCANCHAIDLVSLSPEPKAPPFRDVVKKYEPQALEEALAEGIVTGHDKMPEFTFEPEQVAAIVAYLDTLKAE
jgi:mono/diheme cytochrome c family protein